MSDKMSLIRANLRKIAERYNPDHDLFDERIQVNYVDAQLGVAVGLLAEEVEALKVRLAKLEAFL